MELKAQEISARANICCYFWEHKTDGNIVLLQIQNYCQAGIFYLNKRKKKKDVFKKTIFYKEKIDAFNTKRKDTNNKIFILLLFQF